jgi:uncharacterized membrane protein YbhN (UPF0104 family)
MCVRRQDRHRARCGRSHPPGWPGSETGLDRLAIVAVVAVVTGLTLAVPLLRRLAAGQVLPRVRQIWGNLRQVAISPRKLLLAGGSFARQLLVAITLSVSLRAFGDHLWLPVLIVIVTLAGIIGVSPSPGGMGVVEAA